MNLTDYAHLERFSREWRRFVFEDPRFEGLSPLGQKLAAGHVLDLEDWVAEEWARLYGLEVVADAYPCLHLLLGQRGAELPGTSECDDCTRLDYLVNVRVFRSAKGPCVLASNFDVPPTEQTIERARRDAADMGLEFYVGDYPPDLPPSLLFANPERM